MELLNYDLIAISSPLRRYSETKSTLPNVFLLGGGLGKLQGGIKEEEYFSSINHGLMCNIRKHIESSKNADYMRNWDEYQKTLDNAAFYNTTCLNKYKDLHEEAFFLNEVLLRILNIYASSTFELFLHFRIRNV